MTHTSDASPDHLRHVTVTTEAMDRLAHAVLGMPDELLDDVDDEFLDAYLELGLAIADLIETAALDVEVRTLNIGDAG